MPTARAVRWLCEFSSTADSLVDRQPRTDRPGIPGALRTSLDAALSALSTAAQVGLQR